MKRIILTFILALPLLAVQATAQQSGDPTIQMGHFEIAATTAGVTNYTNVNYSLAPMPVITTLNVGLNTPAARYMAFDVLDAANTVQTSWTPATVSNDYNTAVDVTALAPGRYHINVKDSTGVLYTIPFTK